MDGDSVTEGKPSEQPRPTMTEVFYRHLPYYLSIGMTADEYWNGSTSLVKSYREAHEMCMKREEWARWRQGLYVYNALLNAAPVIRTNFGKGKVEPGKYPEEPWPLTEKEAEERRQRDARERYYHMREKLMAEAKQARERRAEEADTKEASEDA